MKPNVFKSTKAQKQEARERLSMQDQTRGDTVAYNEALLQTYERFADTRKRANTGLSGDR